jgi:hypothetical protein
VRETKGQARQPQATGTWTRRIHQPPARPKEGRRLRGTRRQLVLTQELEVEFARVAQANDRSFSAEMRRAMRAHIERHAPEDDDARAAGRGRRADRPVGAARDASPG